MVLQPSRAHLARPLLESVDQSTGLVALAGERLGAAHLGRDLGEWCRRIGVQLRQSILGGAQLCLGRSQPAACPSSSARSSASLTTSPATTWRRRATSARSSFWGRLLTGTGTLTDRALAAQRHGGAKSARVRKHRPDVFHVLRLLVVRRGHDDGRPARAQAIGADREHAAGVAESDGSAAGSRVERLRIDSGARVVDGEAERPPEQVLPAEEPDRRRRSCRSPRSGT